jgi:hypothetical protein
VRLTLSLWARTEALPEAARRLLTEAARPSALWDRFPDDAMLAVAGRADFRALLDVLGEFLTAEAREALHEALERNLGAPSGKDFLKEVLPAVGPDWGLCVTAPPSSEKGWFPRAVFAVGVRPEPAGADQALLSAVNLYAQLAVIGHNRSHKDPIGLKAARLDGVEVKYLAGERAFPPGLQPAFALHGGHLLFASSPEVLKDFAAARPTPGRRPGGAVPLVRVSVREVCRFVKGRREPLLEVVASQNGMAKEEAERRLDRLLAALELIDRVEVGQTTEAGKLALTFRVQTVQPLK